MHPSTDKIVGKGECTIDIKQYNSNEPTLVAKADIYIKDKTPHEYKDGRLDKPCLAYSTKATITVFGNIVPRSIKKQCFERGSLMTDSCIYEFDIKRNNIKYHVELPLQGYLSSGSNMFDIQSCWLDYPLQNDITWIEIPVR